MMVRMPTTAAALAAILGTALLSACQSAAPTTPQTIALKQEADLADLRNASAFCAMINEANSRTASAGKPLPANPDCEYFQRNGTLKGYRIETRGGIIGLPHNMRLVANYSRAQKAVPPASVTARGKEAIDLFRKLLARGFDEQTAIAVTKTGAFSSAVTAFQERPSHQRIITCPIHQEPKALQRCDLPPQSSSAPPWLDVRRSTPLPIHRRSLRLEEDPSPPLPARATSSPSAKPGAAETSWQNASKARPSSTSKRRPGQSTRPMDT